MQAFTVIIISILNDVIAIKAWARATARVKDVVRTRLAFYLFPLTHHVALATALAK